MMRYLILPIAALAQIGSTPTAAAPTAKELLTRFSVTTDRCQRSFACTEEGTRVCTITKASSPHFRLGEYTWYYWREHRWDGRQFRRRERAWGEREFGPPSEPRSEGQAEYHIDLSKLDCLLQYSGSMNRLQDGIVGYRAIAPDREVVRRSAINNTVLLSRIDLELRGCPTVTVRPRMEPVNGIDCYVLDAQSTETRHTVWIDPNHGYNMAKSIRESKSGRSVCLTVAFKQVNGTWVPVERVFDMNTFTPLCPTEQHILERVRVTEFKIDPDHKGLKSFEFDDQIPNGTRLFWGNPDGTVLTDYVWIDGKPVRKPKK